MAYHGGASSAGTKPWQKEVKPSYFDAETERLKQELIGKTLPEARRLYTRGVIRVVREERVAYPVQDRDYDRNRLNVAVVSNVIVDIENRQ